MSEYLVISAPGEKTCQQTWETMNNITSKQNNLSTNYKFHIPDLKVGQSLLLFNCFIILILFVPPLTYPINDLWSLIINDSV